MIEPLTDDVEELLMFIDTEADPAHDGYFIHTVRVHKDQTLVIQNDDGTSASIRMQRA